MKLCDIKLGKIYRFQSHPTTGYAKAIAILKSGEGVNTHNYSIVKCEHTVMKNDNMGFIRYFNPTNLIEI